MQELSGLRILTLAIMMLFVACTRATVSTSSEVGSEPVQPTAEPETTEAPAPVRITLWHGWTDREIESLDEVITGFHELNPGIRVSTRLVPFDELQAEARAAWSEGDGPTLLFGASDWAADLHSQDLVREIAGLIPVAVLDQVPDSARMTAEVDGVLVGVPHALTGVVLYRNTDLLPTALGTLEELLAVDGVVLEQGFFFSMGHLVTACGGTLTNPDGTAGFAGPAGECWLEMLSTFPGVYYSDTDLDAFKADGVPVIIDGTWSLPGIVAALGEDAVAIDPWPTAAGGRLSGVVRSEVIYLGGAATPEEVAAAAAFIEHMIGTGAQLILTDPAGAGHIPVVAEPAGVDRLRYQAAVALSGGIAQPGIGNCYWGAMDTVLQGFISGSIDAKSALAAAAELIDAAVAAGTC